MHWRRNAGIAYGGIQSVHLVIVLAMFTLLDEPPTETIMVIVGSMGLALSLAMLVTSFPGPTRALGASLWKIVHKAGFHVFMFIYFFRLCRGSHSAGPPNIPRLLGDTNARRNDVACFRPV